MWTQCVSWQDRPCYRQAIVQFLSVSPVLLSFNVPLPASYTSPWLAWSCVTYGLNAEGLRCTTHITQRDSPCSQKSTFYSMLWSEICSSQWDWAMWVWADRSWGHVTCNSVGGETHQSNRGTVMTLETPPVDKSYHQHFRHHMPERAFASYSLDWTE
jgi:hypothetical protein